MDGWNRMVSFLGYPPVKKHGNGKSPFSIGNTSSTGPFSIAMLVYQRVIGAFFFRGLFFLNSREGIKLLFFGKPQKKWCTVFFYSRSDQSCEDFSPQRFKRKNHIQVVVSNIFYFHTYLGKIPILTIFQRG